MKYLYDLAQYTLIVWVSFNTLKLTSICKCLNQRLPLIQSNVPLQPTYQAEIEKIQL